MRLHVYVDTSLYNTKTTRNHATLTHRTRVVAVVVVVVVIVIIIANSIYYKNSPKRTPACVPLQIRRGRGFLHMRVRSARV